MTARSDYVDRQNKLRENLEEVEQGLTDLKKSLQQVDKLRDVPELTSDLEVSYLDIYLTFDDFRKL